MYSRWKLDLEAFGGTTVEDGEIGEKSLVTAGDVTL